MDYLPPPPAFNSLKELETGASAAAPTLISEPQHDIGHVSGIKHWDFHGTMPYRRIVWPLPGSINFKIKGVCVVVWMSARACMLRLRLGAGRKYLIKCVSNSGLHTQAQAR